MSDRTEPLFDSVGDRLVAAALDLDDAFDLRRVFEDAAVVRAFVLACQAVRDRDRTGEWESDAT